MQRHRFMKTAWHIYFTLFLLFVPAMPGHSAELLQRDWMFTLVDALGWSYGLPDEPQDPDYMNILSGNRNFRFEAEDVHAQSEDNVSLMDIRNFGPFSGRGWLLGTQKPTAVNMKVILPLSGEYQVYAHLRKAGHQFKVAGQTVTVDAGQEFTEVKIGTFQLSSGIQEIVATLPPYGAIDYITFSAPNLSAITPDGGWQPDEPLKWEIIRTTLVQLLDLAPLFPSDPEPLVIEAEELAPNDAKIVTTPHLGRPSAGKWLRTAADPVEIRFPLVIKTSGFYDLSLRAMGNPVKLIIGDHHEIELEAKAYLDDYIFSSLYFFAGNNNISISLPPGGGIDRLSLTGRHLESTAVMSLLGLEQSEQPELHDLDILTSLLAAFGVNR